MVAVILIVASVVIIAMLQGQTESFGEYSSDQTEGSSCGLAQQRLAVSIDCDNDADASGYPSYENNEECWDSDSDDARDSVCSASP